jgi:hypothetical protein
LRNRKLASVDVTAVNHESPIMLRPI